jgi:cobalamin biosynthesis Mg chelatase CobN
VKVGTRTKEIKVSAVSASGTTAEKSVEVELTSTPDLPWVAPSSVATATESNSGSSMSIYIYVLIALLILVAIGYMRRKKATEAK